MPVKPTYEELEQRIQMLEYQVSNYEQIHESLERSMERFMLVSNAASIATWGWNSNENTITWFDDSEEMLGFQCGSIGTDYKDCTKWVHPDDLDVLNQSVSNIFKEKQTEFTLEFRIIRPDGEIHWISASGRIIYKQDGNPAKIIGVILNISKYMEIDERLSDVQRVGNIGSFRLNVIAGVWSGTQMLYSILGVESKPEYTVEEWVDIIHPEHRESLESYQKKVIEEKSRFAHDYRIIRRSDGEIRWMYSRGELQFDNNGNVIGMIGTTQDITERKQAEEALKKSEKQLEKSNILLNSVLEGTTDAIFVKDLNGRYVLANMATCKALGKNLKEVIGKDDGELFSSESYDVVRMGDSKALETNSTVLSEERLDTAYGETVWMVNKTPLRDLDGNIIGLIGVSRNITNLKKVELEKRELEARLIQSQKMEAIGQLAGGVAHDINNMLGVITGYTEIALEEPDLKDSIRNNLQEILNAGLRSSDTTRQLLAFARRQPIIPKVLDLNESIEGMLKMLRRLIGESVDLRWRPESTLWLIKMDPSQIDQIMANLCVNARDALNSGVGKITIETRNIVFDNEDCEQSKGLHPGKYVMLTVSDNGCGMDKPTMDKIFEPFYTTKEMGKGTGLGLATIYGIIKQNDCFINVYSKLGIGTTFNIYFPKHITITEQKQQMRSITKIGGNETILVVEDEISLLTMVKQMLESYGYQVLTSHTPSEALLLAKEHPGISLLLTDVIMPEMNGRNLLKRMTTLIPGVMCLYMSGYTNDIIASHGILNENVNFIKKPFSLHDLAIKVREVLDGNISKAVKDM